MGFNRCLVLAVTILLIVSCKVRIVVPQGGDVVSQSGALHCASGKTCNIDVVDIFFEEVLVAEPALGYTFKSWKRWPGSKNGFCGGQSTPCALTTAGFDAFPALLAVLGSNQVFHLRPVFQKAAAACTPGDPRNTASFNLADPDNTFVMVVSEAAISMSIVRNAVPYQYACDSDFSIFMDCGGLDFDIATQTLEMTNVTVENTNTGSVLTIDGTVVWN